MKKPIHSLKKKITGKFLIFSVSVILTFIVVVGILQFLALKSQMEKALSAEAQSILRLFENRLEFLTEKTKDFSENSFVKNSLIDAEGRKLYLPQLIKDFSSTAGLTSVSVVDFSGKIIQSSSERIPNFQGNKNFRPALEVGKNVIWLDPGTKNIMMVSPILFYETPQGAIIAEFRINDIVRHVFKEGSNAYYKIFSDNDLVQSQGYDKNTMYTSTRTSGGQDLKLVNGLKIELEMGQSNSYFYGPIQKLIIRLSLFSILFLVLALYMARKFGETLSSPILELCDKISSKNSLNYRCSPVGTEDELELLAEKFDSQTDSLIQAKLELEDRVNQRTLELSQTNENLKSEIETRKQIEFDLEKAKTIAEKANRSKSLFLANMSHEIRTPLNAILGYSQILNKDPVMTEDQKKTLSTIYTSGKNLLVLINDILDICKIEAGKMELKTTSFDLNELIVELSYMFDQPCQKKGLTWKVENPYLGHFFVRGDVGKLRQVLINLIGNAVKFTDSGEIHFSVKPLENDLIEFVVKDTGKGISLEAQQAIFEPFQQGEEGNEKGGTGLGLAISRNQIALMGGDLKLDSVYRQGTVFSFSIQLPESQDEKGVSKNKAQQLKLESSAKVTAIIADDVIDNLDILSKILSNIGVNIVRAENGKEVLEKVENEIPDIIFMDIRMPVMDGIESAKQIIKKYGPKKIRLVAVTASAFEHEREEFKEAGFHDFIIKPFLIEKIYQCLKTQLNIEFELRGESYSQKVKVDPAPVSVAEHAITREQVDHLRKSAEIGNITEIENSLGALIKNNKKNQGLVKELSSFMDEYDMEGFLKYLGTINNEK